MNALLEEMSNTDGAIIEVSQDASVSGQFYDFLEEFCTNFQQAVNREEILLRRPYTDDDEKKTYFRLKDFEAFLRKNKFFEYKSHKVAQRLRDLGGHSTSIKIKNKSVRVWVVPSFDNVELKIDLPDLGQHKESPF